jgi:hypothetical protein
VTLDRERLNCKQPARPRVGSIGGGRHARYPRGVVGTGPGVTRRATFRPGCLS